jgi:hypothetical protein
VSEGDLNPGTGEISLITDLNSKTGEKSPDRGVHAAMVASVPGLASTGRRRLTVYQGAAGPAVSQAEPGTYLLGALWPGNGTRRRAAATAPMLSCAQSNRQCGSLPGPKVVRLRLGVAHASAVVQRLVTRTVRYRSSPGR